MFFEKPRKIKQQPEHYAEVHGLEFVVINPYGHTVRDKRGNAVFFKTMKAAQTYASILNDKKG